MNTGDPWGLTDPSKIWNNYEGPPPDDVLDQGDYGPSEGGEESGPEAQYNEPGQTADFSSLGDLSQYSSSVYTPNAPSTPQSGSSSTSSRPIRNALIGDIAIGVISLAGRYKAQLIDGRSVGYLRMACDYVHLNPVRAGIVAGDQKLESFPWSSYRAYRWPKLRPRLAAGGSFIE